VFDHRGMKSGKQRGVVLGPKLSYVVDLSGMQALDQLIDPGSHYHENPDRAVVDRGECAPIQQTPHVVRQSKVGVLCRRLARPGVRRVHRTPRHRDNAREAVLDHQVAIRSSLADHEVGHVRT
jgi:hypothetical protein